LYDGRELSVSNPDYAALFKTIKYSWGGNESSNTFLIPDLSGGAYPVGAHKTDANPLLFSDFLKQSAPVTAPLVTTAIGTRLEVGQYRSLTSEDKQQFRPNTTPAVAVVNYILKY